MFAVVAAVVVVSGGSLPLHAVESPCTAETNTRLRHVVWVFALRTFYYYFFLFVWFVFGLCFLLLL